MSQLHYFLTGNTAQGHMSLIPEALKSIQYLCIVDGPYLSDNSAIMQRFYESLKDEGVELELIHHPSDPDHLQGIIFPAINLAILSSTPPHRILAEKHQESVTTLNVYDFYNMEVIDAQRATLDDLTVRITELHQEAYKGYAQALNIHDEWEKIYIDQSSFKAANAFAEQLMHKLLPDREPRGRSSDTKYRFLGAATPKGAVDFVPELTLGLKRYLIKGRPGSGKSTLLRKLVARGTELGYDLEIYQCGLDPKSLDMVICRELGFAIFDSTAPHEYEPTFDTDEIIDMYEISINPSTDDQFKDELAEISARYREQMKQSNKLLKEAEVLEHKRAELTQSALNMDSLNQAENLIVQSIKAFINRSK
ncbi:hypothetical protein [Paenibacillus sp. FSL W7-1287]|uniref:hypothetical protein n=1 Tax=Paenibacillus sp. FSL W7-1287 TaxID=2954538 RepID=UPI0030FA8C62